MNGNSYNSEVKLQRVLKLRDLVIYGIILIQPGASLALFGHANNLSKGHAVATILVAMVAMILTAISYGRMANRYPSAGSAYT
jgi:amino acid transporter